MLKAESQAEMDQWTTAIRFALGLKPELQSSQGAQVQREVLLCKPIKEGILNKQKKRDQLKKTKPTRLVLTHNFIYYFPTPSVSKLAHFVILILLDSVTREIPYNSSGWGFR